MWQVLVSAFGPSWVMFVESILALVLTILTGLFGGVS